MEGLPFFFLPDSRTEALVLRVVVFSLGMMAEFVYMLQSGLSASPYATRFSQRLGKIGNGESQ